MQIQGNALFSVLGSLQQPASAGQAPPPRSAQPGPAETRVRAAADTAPAQGAPGGQSPAAASKPSRAQSLEQAVQSLSDQGRLPPRGSLVDLRA